MVRTGIRFPGMQGWTIQSRTREEEEEEGGKGMARGHRNGDDRGGRGRCGGVCAFLHQAGGQCRPTTTLSILIIVTIIIITILISVLAALWLPVGLVRGRVLLIVTTWSCQQHH